MFSNLQINRTLAKNVRMSVSKKSVSAEAIEKEWEEIQAAQENPAHFQSLYTRYYEPIFRFVFRRTNEEDLTADICAQVFLKALQKIKQYQFKGVPFSAWLFRIASNEVTQYFRNHQRNRIVSAEEENLAEMIEELEEVDSEDRRQGLIKALDQLKEPDLQLIEMRFFEQRTFKEIAEILDLTESNAKVKTYRILQRLRKRMTSK